MNNDKPDLTGEPRQEARPPRRYLNFTTFCQLPGVTSEMIADMSYCLHGDGYDRVKPATLAFMWRHNLAWVSLYGQDGTL
jgi:hypothetical protein